MLPPTTLPKSLLPQESSKRIKRPLSLNTSSSINEAEQLNIEQTGEGQVGDSEIDYDETSSITSQEDEWKLQKTGKQLKKKEKQS